MKKVKNVKITMASPDTIRSWSNGEIKKPETIDYRTFKPLIGGLFCEKIFGPTQDYECACGKYKGRKYEGTICERCNVKVEPKSARRRNMGHIELAAPVVHLWFLKSTPSILANLLNMTSKDLENIIYFGSRRIIEKIYIVVDGKSTPFDKGDTLYQTEYDIYTQFWDFEAQPAVVVKNPSGPVKSDIGGIVSFREEETHTDKIMYWISVSDKTSHSYSVHKDQVLSFKDGDAIEKGQELISKQTIDPIYSPIDGTIEVDEGLGIISISPITTTGDQPSNFSIPYGAKVLVKDGKKIEKGDKLTESVTYPTISSEISGTVVFDKGLSVHTLIDGKVRSTSTGKIRVENVIEERHYPVIEGSIIYVNEGEKVEEGTHIADRFVYEEEILSVDEYQMLEQHYPGMFSPEPEIENDRPIMVITEIDEEVSEEIGKQVGDILTDNEFEAYETVYPAKITAKTGAEAVKILLNKLDLEGIIVEIEDELKDLPKSSARVIKLRKRLQIVKNLIESSNAPSWMIMDAVPVIPPELRPMIQIEGGRFATTDLNDLYRRVINRNNRLKKLIDLGAPEVIVRNEKRMLQQSVDALIYNGRMSKAITDRGGRPLKSLTDLLKGKKGRFRRNLLGKRVDYSGRAVIVVGPDLKIHECGIPKKMALELFKPFVLSRLLGSDSTSKSAIKLKKAIIENEMPQAWEALEDVIKDHPVMLNRAPTLHRMSIQAFIPKLIEGNAIQLSPLVCPPFNADFDGDQMAVHVPLSAKAQAETKWLMLSRYNIISPANGQPLSMPGKDIIFGVYYLTMVGKDYESIEEEDIQMKFSCYEEVLMALEHSKLKERNQSLILHTPIMYFYKGQMIKTTPGRVIMNQQLPEELKRFDQTFGKKQVKGLIYDVFKTYGIDKTADLLDYIKELGFHYATVSGLTFSVTDVEISEEKSKIQEKSEEKIAIIQDYYDNGYLTENERHREIIKIWDKATADIQKATVKQIARNPYNPVQMMISSGARGNEDQLRQLAGMRGLMAGPAGDIIEIPIRSNFREGLSVSEFFLSTHGGRKGAADTALRTSNAGYLTRRLVDVAQGIVVTQADCGTHNGLEATSLRDDDIIIEDLESNIFGRVLSKPIFDPLTGEILINEKTGRKYERDLMIGDSDAEFLSHFSKKVPVFKESILNFDKSKGEHHEYVEVLENIFTKNGELVVQARTPINSHLIQECKDRDINEIPVIEYPVVGNFSKEKVMGKDGKTTLLVEEEKIDPATARLLMENDIQEVDVRPSIIIRSVFTCESENGVCAKCYGMDLSNHKIVNIGEAVGVVAAQSIGEPGNQLSMRTFHTGDIASTSDITQALPRAEELFEARKKLNETPAVFSTVRGFVKDIKYPVSRISRTKPFSQSNNKSSLNMDSFFNKKMNIRKLSISFKELKKFFESSLDKIGSIILEEKEKQVYNITNKEKVKIFIEDYNGGINDYELSSFHQSKVSVGDKVFPGSVLSSGVIRPRELMSELSIDVTFQYMLREIKRVYSEQGIDFHNKHIEIIISQMLGKVEIVDPGSTDYMIGDLVLVNFVKRENERLLKNNAKVNDNRKKALKKRLLKHVLVKRNGKIDEIAKQGDEITSENLREFIDAGIKDLEAFSEIIEDELVYQINMKNPIKYRRKLLGITEASLKIESWLSAASSQQTTQILAESALKGAVDELIGVKENLIIGRNIPAGTGMNWYSGVTYEENNKRENLEKWDICKKRPYLFES